MNTLHLFQEVPAQNLLLLPVARAAKKEIRQYVCLLDTMAHDIFDLLYYIIIFLLTSAVNMSDCSDPLSSFHDKSPQAINSFHSSVFYFKVFRASREGEQTLEGQ